MHRHRGARELLSLGGAGALAKIRPASRAGRVLTASCPRLCPRPRELDGSPQLQQGLSSPRKPLHRKPVDVCGPCGDTELFSYISVCEMKQELT